MVDRIRKNTDSVTVIGYVSKLGRVTSWLSPEQCGYAPSVYVSHVTAVAAYVQWPHSKRRHPVDDPTQTNLMRFMGVLAALYGMGIFW